MILDRTSVLHGALLSLVLATSSSGGTPPSPPARTAPAKVHGVTISTHTSGREWGWDSIVPTMKEIQSLGAGWVAIHPYAAIRGDGSVLFRDFEREKPPRHLVRPIREAHALGLKILVKPHLAYWGSPFRWRGEISFQDPGPWQRFWRGYRHWILTVIRACRQADGFVVGTELDRTLGHESEWRQLISEIRGLTDAPLTYAANWTDYQQVPFWDALDVIGVQAYFPLTDRPQASVEEIDQGWRRWMGELRLYAGEQNRKVVFTELGYNRSMAAPVRPWDHRVDGPEAEYLQEICLREALRAVEAEPSVAGVFLWKWFPGPLPVGRDFQLATPRLKQAIAGVWR
ncbi:MAG: hypothetical protein ACE5HD_06175 [Acidobacteriota bacterium]